MLIKNTRNLNPNSNLKSKNKMPDKKDNNTENSIKQGTNNVNVVVTFLILLEL